MTPIEYKRRPIRRILGWTLAILGFFHMLYYVSGLACGWEVDVWNIAQACAGMAAAAIGYGVARFPRDRLTRPEKRLLLFVLVAAGLLLLSFSVVETNIILAAAKAYKEPSKADYMIILGSRVRGEQPSLTLQNRLNTGYSYAIRHPEIPIVVSGGQGPGENVSEAEAMKQYLTERGIPDSRIMMENRSSNTYENFQFSKALLAGKTDLNGKTLLVVTSDFHIFRSLKLAERAGLNASGLAAPTPGFTIPKSYMREYAAVIKSYLFDK